MNAIRLATAAERRLHHLESILERQPSTIQDYRIMLRRHFLPFFGDRALAEITSDDVLRYIDAKLGEGLAMSTVNNHLTFLGSVFAYAVKRRWAAANPVAEVDRLRAQADPDVRFLTLSEFSLVLEAIPGDMLGALERPLYMTAALTGLRQGELAALSWRDVDFGARLIRCRRRFTRGRLGRPKTRRSSRAVPMPERLATELADYRERSAHAADDDLVFAHPRTGRPYDASRMRKRFKRTVERAGVREMRFHDLRHTFATQMAAAGAPLRSIQEWMGHRDYKTTSIYADYAPDNREARRWAERAFGEVGSGRGGT